MKIRAKYEGTTLNIYRDGTLLSQVAIVFEKKVVGNLGLILVDCRQGIAELRWSPAEWEIEALVPPDLQDYVSQLKPA